VDDSRHDTDVVVVQHPDGFVGVLLGVHDGPGDPECFGQEL
jgi:hypothetical protein